MEKRKASYFQLVFGFFVLPFFVMSCGESQVPCGQSAGVGGSASTCNLLSLASTTFQQYTGVAPGDATFQTALLTTRNLPTGYAEASAELEVQLAQEIAALQTLPESLGTLDLITSLRNALKDVIVINIALQNSPPTLTELPSNVARVLRDTLRDAERHMYHTIGEQILAGIPSPVDPIGLPSQSQIQAIHEKILFEANKAVLFGENVRADLLRIAAVTFGNYAQEIGTASSEQLFPIPAPTNAVASPFSEGGIIGSLAQNLRVRRKFVDPNARFLPPSCDNIILDEDTCPVEPTQVTLANDPVDIISNTSGVPADMAAAANEINSDVNAAISGFLTTPASGPVNASLRPNIATLEIESAKLLTYFRLIAQSVQSRKFIQQLELSQTLLGVLAALLNVDSPINPGTIPTPQLDNINLSQIPPTLATPHTIKPFTDQKSPSITLEASVIDGVLFAEKAIHGIVGENIQMLFNSQATTDPLQPPSPEVIAKIIQNYENTAINADNNFESARAALLRIIAKGFALSSYIPPALPVPAASPVVEDTLSQVGYAETIAQRAHQRRRDVDSNLAGYPEGCDDRTWDSNTCILVP